jgi:hypothetical protein
VTFLCKATRNIARARNILTIFRDWKLIFNQRFTIFMHKLQPMIRDCSSFA